ncbi:hypothetical protein CPB86DRAFT_256586 [Serendipita vermifera]|nr:hypothetical protein CPB86DRAFT_256586 [Serendipita vermifera]
MLEGPGYLNGHYVPSMDEMMEYQSTREPWDSNIKYGRYTLYFLSVSLGIFFLVHGIKIGLFWYRYVRWSQANRADLPAFYVFRMRSNSPSSPLHSKLISFLRVLTYPRLPYPVARIVNPIWTVGPLGPNILLFIVLVFISMYCWVNEYFYRSPFYGSPPLAMRSEWLACALIPFLFVLGAKRNLISWITGVSHDKLQVLHQGFGFLTLYMSLVHVFSEIIQSKMELPWTEVYKSDPVWWTGFAALGPLIWLYLASLPFIRRRLYESFYILHIIASILFLAFLYKHGFGLLDTNAYMNATLALFGFGIVARLLMMVVSNLFFHHRAQLSYMNGWIHVSIPTNMRWSPGAHIFVRFATIRPLESHPFTISSIPSSEDGKQSEMRLMIRPETGFTRTLADAAASTSPERQFLVIVDGPYGESGTNSLRSYQHVLLLAGGAGITFIAPILADLVQAMKEKDGPCKTIELVWVAKQHDIMKSFESEFAKAKASAASAGGDVIIRFYVTHDTDNEEKSLENASSEKDDKVNEEEGSPLDEFPVTGGRPDLPSLISSKGQTWKGNVGVAVCGPLSFMTDASNAVSKVQLDILRGRASCTEMYLRSESFGW